jgi:hypothetical protein
VQGWLVVVETFQEVVKETFREALECLAQANAQWAVCTWSQVVAFLISFICILMAAIFLLG